MQITTLIPKHLAEITQNLAIPLTKEILLKREIIAEVKIIAEVQIVAEAEITAVVETQIEEITREIIRAQEEEIILETNPEIGTRQPIEI